MRVYIQLVSLAFLENEYFEVIMIQGVTGTKLSIEFQILKQGSLFFLRSVPTDTTCFGQGKNFWGP